MRRGRTIVSCAPYLSHCTLICGPHICALTCKLHLCTPRTLRIKYARSECHMPRGGQLLGKTSAKESNHERPHHENAASSSVTADLNKWNGW